MSEDTPLDPATSEIAYKQFGHVWRSTTQRYVGMPRESYGDRAEDTDG